LDAFSQRGGITAFADNDNIAQISSVRARKLKHLIANQARQKENTEVHEPKN